MSKHTPGPWTISQEDGWPWTYYIESKSADRWVVRIGLDTYSTADTKESANAREANHLIRADALLITAAPELLAALKEVETYSGGLPVRVQEIIDSAIAKATGETS